MSAPTKIKMHRKSQILEVVFENESYLLSAEFLRVLSPSAEVKGHGPGQEKLQLNKQNVGISNILPQGNYAIKIVFNDGHDSGIYTWDYLQNLGKNQSKLWEKYLSDVETHQEQQITSAVKWVTPTKPS